MEPIKIETAIKPPERRPRKEYKERITTEIASQLELMEPGHSILADSQELAMAIRSWMTRRGIRFVSRTEDDGVRIWRTEPEGV